jgi:hypothetical protein
MFFMNMSCVLENQRRTQRPRIAEGKLVLTAGLDTYPGNRRLASEIRGPSPDIELINSKIGGNSLQAIYRHDLVVGDLLVFSVPENGSPRDDIHVSTFDGSDRMITALVPDTTFPG